MSDTKTSLALDLYFLHLEKYPTLLICLWIDIDCERFTHKGNMRTDLNKMGIIDTKDHFVNRKQLVDLLETPNWPDIVEYHWIKNEKKMDLTTKSLKEIWF